MASPLDDLYDQPGPASDVARDFATNPAMPGEMPAARETRLMEQQEVQRRVQAGVRAIKAKDLARNRIPFATNPLTGDPEAIKDASGKPLQRFNPGQQVAYDSSGKPKRINWSEDGRPEVVDPFAGIPIVTNPKTGQQVQKVPGLPANIVGVDPAIEARKLEEQKDKAVAAAATALGRKLSIEEAGVRRQEVDAKARLKKLKDQWGIDPDNLESGHEAIEAAHQAALQDPRANDTRGWFGGELTPESLQFRQQLEQRKAAALDEVTQLRAGRERDAAARGEIAPQRTQLESIQGSLADRKLDRLRAQGVEIPELQESQVGKSGNPLGSYPGEAGSTPAPATLKPEALPDGTPVQQIPGTDKLPEVGFTDVFAHNSASRYIPFASGVADIADIAKIGSTFLKLRNNPDDPRWTTEEGQKELTGAKEYLDWQKRERTFGGTVAEILSELPSFAGELAATWGAYSAGAQAGKKGAKALVQKLLGEGAEKLLESKLGSFAVKGAGAAVGAARQLPFSGGLRIAAETMQRQLPGVQIEPGDDGLLSGIVTSEGDGFGEALRKSIGNQYVELLSERTGGALGFIPGMDKLAQLKAGLAKKWLGEGANRTVKGLAETLQKVGWNGVLGEMFEERVGGVLQGAGAAGELLADGEDAEKAKAAFIKEAIPTGKQLLAEGVAFGIPGAGIAAYQALRGQPEGGTPPDASATATPGMPPSPAPTPASPPTSIIPPGSRAPKVSTDPVAADTAAGAGLATPAPALSADAEEAPPLEPSEAAVESEPDPELPETVDAAAHEAATSPTNGRPEPTDDQKEAGNYKLGHFRLGGRGGLDVSIENPATSVRRSRSDAPEKWEVEMKGAHYGRVKGAYSKDGELLDIFVAEGTPKDYNGPVYVVNQNNADGSFDEHKALAGAASPEEAAALYSAQYNPGFARAGSVATFPDVASFRAWAKGASKRTAPAKGHGPLWVPPQAAPENVTQSVNNAPSSESAPVEQSDKPISPQPTGTVPTPPRSGEPAAPGGEAINETQGSQKTETPSTQPAKDSAAAGGGEANEVQPGDSGLANEGAEHTIERETALIIPNETQGSQKPQTEEARPEGSGAFGEKGKSDEVRQGDGGVAPSRSEQSEARAKSVQKHAQKVGSRETGEDLGSGLAIEISDRSIIHNPQQVSGSADYIDQAGGNGEKWVEFSFDEEETHKRDLIASKASTYDYSALHEMLWRQAPKPIREVFKQVYPDKISDPQAASELLRMMDQLRRTDEITESHIGGRPVDQLKKLLNAWSLPKEWAKQLERMQDVTTIGEQRFLAEKSVEQTNRPEQQPEAKKPDRSPAEKNPEEAAAFHAWRMKQFEDGVDKSKISLTAYRESLKPEEPALTQDKGEKPKPQSAPREVTKKKLTAAQQKVKDAFGDLLNASSPTSYPRWKSLYIDRSGIPKGTMRDQGHGEIARDIAPDRLKTMLRARTQGSTIYLEATSGSITPSQRKFANEFAEQHGLTVQTNDRRPFMLGASDPVSYATPIPKDKIPNLIGPIAELAAEASTPEAFAQSVREISDKLVPYTQSLWFFAKGAGAEGPVEPDWGSIYNPAKETETPEKPSFHQLAENIQDTLSRGQSIDRRALAEMAKGSGLSAKQVDESAELGVVMAARDMVEFERGNGTSDAAIFDKLVDLYERQPNLTAKTSDSKIRQAYSTPIPLAFVGAAFTGNKGKAMDSTAGNSAMLLDIAPEDGVVNELDPSRVEALKALGFQPQEGDVFAFLKNYDGEVQVVRINPPFGVVRDENGEAKQFPLGEGTTREIDHAIVMGTLEKMAKNGRAVLIIGGSQATIKPERRKHYGTGDRAPFFKSLYEQYGVLDHFTVNGDLYSKQGAGWPVDVILIDGRRPSPIQLPTQQPPRILNTWEEVKNELTRTDADRIKAGQYDEAADRAEIAGSLGGIRGALEAGERSDESRDSRPSSSEAAAGSGAESGEPNAIEPGDSSDERVSAGTGSAEGVELEPAASGGERPRGLPVTGEKTSFHKPYKPVSKGPSFGIETPINMADPQREALERIEREVGKPLDQFVAEKLNYPAGTDLGQYFAAEQIDALASAIYNLERGGALVLGDMTGVGKGRVAAGMIEYAKANGLIPVFVTKDDKLYSALLDDTAAIGRSTNPAFTDNGLAITHPVTNQPIRQTSSKAVLKYIADNGALPPENDVLFTKYSQINADKDPDEDAKTRQRTVASGGTPMDGPRMKALRAIAPRALFILDESHLASGDSIQGRRTMSVIEPARAYYSSATFAKRAESMPLYFKTNLRLAADNMAALVGVFEQGGVVMQQIANSMLAQDGQYIRRERTFDGVPFSTHINLDTAERDRGLADQYTEGLREILSVSNRMKEATKSLNEIMTRMGKRLHVPTVKLESADFASQIHNFVAQYLLAIKAESAAMQALKAIKEGHPTQDGSTKRHKVIVAVQNTMEGPITELQSRRLPLTFNGLLLRTLDDLRTVTSGRGNSATVIRIGRNPSPEFANMSARELEDRLIEIKVSTNEQGEMVRQGVPNEKVAMEIFRRLANDVFVRAERAVSDLDLGGMPLSPIDYMRDRLEKEGVKTGELTGRESGLNAEGKIYKRPGNQISKNGQLATLADFNNGDTDFLVINGSASTGVSAHASEKFGRKDPRMMIVVQPHLDIAEFMQTLGRIFRSGQIEKPRYMLLQTALPAEMRPASVLGMKMAALNANTTSNTDSQVQQGAQMPDLFNEYGDEVMHRYLAQHPEFARALQWPKLYADKGQLKTRAELKETFEGEDGKLIRGVTSYAAVQPWEDQEAMWQKVLSDYNSLIGYLDSIGENTLRATVEDFSASTINSEPFTGGRGSGSSAFASPSTLETVTVKAKKKPLEAVEVLEMANKAAKDRFKTLEDFKAKWRAESAKQIEERGKRSASDPEKAKASLKKQLDQRYNDIFSAIDMLGRPVSISTKDGNKIGAVVGIEFNEEKLLTPSEHTLTVVLNTIRQQIKIPSSQASERLKSIDRDSFIEQYNATREDKVPRRIVTGNLVAASARLNGQGKVIQFSRADGTTDTGILLPLDYSISTAERETVENSAQARQLIESGKALSSPEMTVMIRKDSQGEILFITKASKARGGKFWQDPILNAAMKDGHMEQRNQDMVGRIQSFGAVVDRLKAMQETLGYDKTDRLGASNPTASSKERVEAMKPGPKGGAGSVKPGDSPKEAIANSIGVFRKIGNSVWNYLTKPPSITTYKQAKGEWLGTGIDGVMGHQAADHAARELRTAINRKFSRASQESINVYREAGGDAAKIREQMEALKAKGRKKYLPIWEKALNLTAEEKAMADEAGEFYAEYAELGSNTGMLGNLRDDYVNHFWNLAKLNPAKTEAAKAWGNMVMSRLKTSFDNAKARRFGSSFEGIMEGFDPHTLAIGDVMSIYGQTFNHTLADRAFIKRLIRDVRGADGRPAVTASGYAVKVGTTPEGGTAAGVYVMPHARTKVKVRDDEGELTGEESESVDYVAIDHPALRKAKYVGADTDGKPVILEGDLLVHPDFAKDLKNTLGRSALQNTPVVKQLRTANNFIKRTILSLSTFHAVTEGLHAVAHGVNPLPGKLPKVNMEDSEVQELVNSGLMLAGNYNAKQAFLEGLAGGGLFERIPKIGPMLQWWNEWLFEDYIPRLKQQMALKAFRRNLKRFPELSRRQVAEITARQSNDAFGEQNYRYKGENPTAQDVARMTTFAWDFLRSRAQFFGDALKPRYGKEQRKALLLMAVGMAVLCKVIERMLTGENHWDKPFYVVDGNRMYGFRTVPGDVIDAVTDPRRFVNGRLSPLIARPAIEALTGRDYRGVKQTPGEQLAGMIKGMAPMPLKSMVDDRADVGTVGNILNATGIHTKRYSDLTETRQRAREWQIAQGKTNADESYPPSKYLPLKQALEDGNMDKASKAIRELVQQQGKKATREGVEQSLMRPFSGSNATERAFEASLDGEARAQYKRADAKRRQMLQAFNALLSGVPDTRPMTSSLIFNGFQ